MAQRVEAPAKDLEGSRGKARERVGGAWPGPAADLPGWADVEGGMVRNAWSPTQGGLPGTRTLARHRC
eukprot:978359-Alexandrium_andersonii.AAC.1